MPHLIVIAGPNGAGKSTLAPHLLRDQFGIDEFVNADTIAQGLSAFAPESAAIDAARIMLGRLKELSNKRRDFAFETTLATRSYARWLKSLRTDGYLVHVIFLWLSSPELAIERVRDRLRLGGHAIPEDIIRRRYARGIENLSHLYLPLADSWQVYNVSTLRPALIAMGDRLEGNRIINSDLWQKIEK